MHEPRRSSARPAVDSGTPIEPFDGPRFCGAIAVGALLSLVCGLAAAQNCGWSRIDHRVQYDDSGIWDSTFYRSVAVGASALQLGGAVWEGAESRIGRTMWQGVDAQIMAGLAATVGKHIFTRVRPIDENNPCLWFQRGSNYSFPSGEAAAMAALVTPYMLEYGHEYPAVYLLSVLPLYIGAGRIKDQAHWQSDVLAGWAVGGLVGWYAHSRDVPIVIELLPHSFAIGYRHSF